MSTNTRRLRITAVTPGTTFTRKDGGEGRVYELSAETEDGAPVSERLIAFVPPRVGELEDFEVARQDHEHFGASFVLKPPRGSLAQRVGALEQRVADLEQRLGGGQ